MLHGISHPSFSFSLISHRMQRLSQISNLLSTLRHYARGWIVAAGLTAVGSSLGCDAPIDSFEPNRLFAKRLEMNEGIELAPVGSDVDALLLELFGTPDQPLWPVELQSPNEVIAEEVEEGAQDGKPEASPTGELVSLERLQRAAGPVYSDEAGTHYGMYREHCILCHGIAGNGMGATSRLLNPYPRDFRLGKFKFKSTPIGSRPTRDDLRQLLLNGEAGTSMPSFALLPEQDVEALLDYVIYLSIRGEVERGLLMRATYDLDADEQLTRHDAIELAIDAARKWIEAESQSISVPPPPNDLPLVGTPLESPAERERLDASIEHGRQLFVGQVANCASCHGPLGAGDGTNNDFDDWTKDWTTQAGIDPLDKQQVRPMRALGALKPRHIEPRNLQSGIHRGGSRPEDLYRRIVLGIEGTPMPAVPLQPENALGLTERDVWDLVNFLLWLPSQPEGRSKS